MIVKERKFKIKDDEYNELYELSILDEMNLNELISIYLSLDINERINLMKKIKELY